MNINWRGRGIFLNYYLTFPVEYKNAVKERILAAFSRGLMRSLPESLIYAPEFEQFSVTERASEPAAFAAAALERLDIEPDETGVAYAVFDFGGGTTDFDYGIYRLPSEQDGEGWQALDDVIEHFGAAGFENLGGENLLEELAYLTFKTNQSICRQNNIAFSKPIDAKAFAGSEMLIGQTQAAFTNTTLMMSKLRSLWEKGSIEKDAEGKETLRLVNRDGSSVDCEIIIQQDELIKHLETRIQDGLKNFFIALKHAFESKLGQLPESVHILLAGNSSRSRIRNVST